MDHDKHVFFVLKFKCIFEKQVYIFVISPWSILFAKTHKKWNRQWYSIVFTCRRIL